MRRHLPLLLLALTLNTVCVADPLNGSLDLGASVSQSYDARSVFSNPAALGFQTELNGPDLATSFIYGFNRYQNNDFALGASFGYLGLGWERYAAGSDTLSRYGFSLGFPLHPMWFLGMRYVLNRFENTNGFDSADLGLQFRPSHYLSFGVVGNRLNQPSLNGVPLPWQLVLGMTLRPTSWLELAMDADTLSGSNRLLQQWGYQATVAVEPLPGVKLQVGYHDVYHFQAGIQIRFGRTTLFSSAQPGSNPRTLLAGFDATATAYRSVVLPTTETLKLAVTSSLEEKPAPSSFFASSHPTLLGLLDKLDEAEHRSEIKQVFIKLETFPLGLAAAEEVYHQLLSLRSKGKRVEVYLGNAGLKEYLIASAADKIHIAPQGELKMPGLRAERYYLRGTLDKIGLEGEFLARGEYKSAPETFTRRNSSPLNRATTLEELKEAEDHLAQLLLKSRKIDQTAFHKIFETAIFGAEDARAAGLVDAVDSFSENERAESAGTGEEERSQALALAPRVAVIVAQGDILQHRMRALSLSGESQITPLQMQRQFEAALSDPRTGAIVLRVTSPGGEVLPSHEIALMVEKARLQKPVIVSMGDVAASGGYYISAPADRIFAGALTLTGSIGVFLGKPNAAGLFKSIQLNKEILSHFPHAAIFSEDRPWSAADRVILTRRLNEYYEGFVSFVAKNRSIPETAAESAAKGRVWLGDQARGLKLVDESGGYREAIAYAAARAGLSPENYEVWLVQESVGVLDLFADQGFLASNKVSLYGTLRGFFSESSLQDLKWMESLRENPFLYLSPVAFQNE